MPLVLKNEKPMKEKFKNIENKLSVHQFSNKKNKNDSAYMKKYNKIDQDDDHEADDNYGDADKNYSSDEGSSTSSNSSCESSDGGSSSTDDDDDNDDADDDHNHNHDGRNENKSENDKIVMLNTEGCVKDIKNNQHKNYDQNCGMFYSNNDVEMEGNIVENESDEDRNCNNSKLMQKEKYASQDKISFKVNHIDKTHKFMEKIKSKSSTKPNQKYKKYGGKYKRKKRNTKRHSKKRSFKVIKSKLCKKCIKNLLKSLTRHRRKRYVSTSSSSSSSSSDSSSSESSSSSEESSESSASPSTQKKSTSEMNRKHSKKNFHTAKKPVKYRDRVAKHSQKRNLAAERTSNVEHSLMDFSTIPSQRFAAPIKDNVSITSLSHSPFTQLEYNTANYCDKILTNMDYSRQNNDDRGDKNSGKTFEIHHLNVSDFANYCENGNVTQHTTRDNSDDSYNNVNRNETKERKTSQKSDGADLSDHSKSRLLNNFRSGHDDTSCDDHSINKVCLARCDASCDSLSALDKITNDNHVQNTTSSVCDINIYDNEICNLVQTSVNTMHDQTNDENLSEKNNQIDDGNSFEYVQSEACNNPSNTPINVPIKDWTYEYFETPNDQYSKFIFSPEAEVNDNVKGCASLSCLSPANLTTATDVTNATTLTTASTISNACSSSLSSPATQATSVSISKDDTSLQTSTGNTHMTTQLNACTTSTAATTSAETVSKSLIKISFNRQASKFKVLKPMAKKLDQAIDTKSVEKSQSLEEKLNDDEAACENPVNKSAFTSEKSENEISKEPVVLEDAIDKTSAEYDSNNKLYASVKPINVVKTSSNVVKTSPSSIAESSMISTVANYVDENDKILASKKQEQSINSSKYIPKNASKTQKVINRRSHSNEKSRRHKSRSRSPDKYRSDKRYKERSSKLDSHSAGYKRNYKNYEDDGNDKSSDEEDKKMKYRRNDSDKYSRYNDYNRYDKSYYSKSRNKDEKFEKSKKYEKRDKSKSPKKSSTSSSSSQPAQLSTSPPSSSINRHHYNHHEYYKYKYDKQSMRSYPSYRPYPPSVRMPPFMMPPSSYSPFMPPLLPSHPAAPWTSVPDYHQRQPPPQVFLQPGNQPAQIYYEYQIQTVADENEAANSNSMSEEKNEKNDDNNNNSSNMTNKLVEQNKDADNKMIAGNS